MTRANQVAPPLSDLLSGYLQRHAAAEAAGLGQPETGDVVPFEAAPAPPVDPRLAWEETQSVLRLYSPQPEKSPLAPPPDWPSLVSSQEPAMALAMCAGNFPQLVRNLHPLLHADNLAALKPQPAQALSSGPSQDWAIQVGRKPQFPQVLLAIGVLRLARDFDAAAEILQKNEKTVPAPWQPAWANEKAALAWHRGQFDEALASWNSQTVSVPVHFNRGMASLFFGRTADAKSCLNQAVAQLPENGGWHHLGRLYLTLAETAG